MCSSRKHASSVSPQALPAGRPLPSKWVPAPAWAEPSRGTTCKAVGAVLPTRCRKLSMELLVAASALATDSVEGHRSRPSAVTRLDLLKVVGSRPAALARAEADNLLRLA